MIVLPGQSVERWVVGASPTLGAKFFNEFCYNPDVSHIAIRGPIGIDTLNSKNLFNRLSEKSLVRLPGERQRTIHIEDDQSFHWVRIVFDELVKQQDSSPYLRLSVIRAILW